MRPHQFRRLMELLHAQSGAIEEVLKSQETAIRDASQSADEKRGDIPRIIAGAIHGVSEEEANYEKPQRNKEYRQQTLIGAATWATAFFTALAFAAAAYYACVARSQLDQMIEATKQAKRSADLAACALRQNQQQFTETSRANKNQFDDTLAQIKAQTAAQKDSAKSASDAVATAQKQMTLDERPWVGVKSIEVQSEYIVDRSSTNLEELFHPAMFKIKKVTITIINNGKTPASDIAFDGHMFSGTRPRFSKDVDMKMVDTSTGMYAPVPASVLTPLQTGVGEFGGMEKHGTTEMDPFVVVQAFITYLDPLGGPRHITTVCIVIDNQHPDNTYTYCPMEGSNKEE